jgi:hypothetical protein
LAAIGVVRSEDELGKLARQKTDGTSQAGLLKAIRSINPGWGHPVKFRDAHAAFASLWLHLNRGQPMILPVDNWEHWVAAIGAIGQRVLVADSADNELVLTYTTDEILARWEGPRGGWYGIVI